MPVHRRPARCRSYRRFESVGRLLVSHVAELKLLMLALLFLQALFPCFGLLAGPASAAEDSFQERYTLPQAPETLLKEILSRDEFKEDEAQSFIERLWERVYKELARLLAGILKRLPSGELSGIDEQLGWMVVKAMLLGSAVVLVIYALSRVSSLASKKRTFSGNGFPGPEMENSHLAGSRESWDLALMLAEKGDYSEALINLFRFAVWKLNEQGILLFHRGKTNREIIECINNASLREILAEMIPSFNQVRYGKASCDRLEYERFLGLCRRLAERI